jgi:hypothetical protein
VPLVFAAAGANGPHSVRAVPAWRNLQFWMPTLARLAYDAPLILERRECTGELTSAEQPALGRALLLDNGDDPLERPRQPPVPLAGQTHERRHQE